MFGRVAAVILFEVLLLLGLFRTVYSQALPDKVEASVLLAAATAGKSSPDIYHDEPVQAFQMASQIDGTYKKLWAAKVDAAILALDLNFDDKLNEAEMRTYLKVRTENAVKKLRLATLAEVRSDRWLLVIGVSCLCLHVVYIGGSTTIIYNFKQSIFK
jgi:hypothetical protein